MKAFEAATIEGFESDDICRQRRRASDVGLEQPLAAMGNELERLDDHAFAARRGHIFPPGDRISDLLASSTSMRRYCVASSSAGAVGKLLLCH